MRQGFLVFLGGRSPEENHSYRAGPDHLSWQQVCSMIVKLLIWGENDSYKIDYCGISKVVGSAASA
jgi:hypothetical protein